MDGERREPMVVRPGEGTVWHVLGETITRKVASGETGGAYAIVEEVTPPQGGPPLHSHQHEDEVFYVLEGQIEVQCGDQRFMAPSGTVTMLPKNIPHTFRNCGPEPSRVLVLILPGGFEHFFAGVASIVTAGDLAMDAVMQLAEQHGLTIVGPPLTQH